MSSQGLLKGLSLEEKELLLEIVFSQKCAKELVASEIDYLELNLNEANEEKYKQLCKLYDRLYLL